MLRYKSEGEVHKDFHGLTCATLHYLLDNYGMESVQEILKKTAQDVYRSIHEKLKNGDTSELVEYWEYYLGRENGEFQIESLINGIKLTVKNCPALRHLVKLEQEPDHILCDATGIFNEALAEATPFAVEMKSTGTFSCEQMFYKKSGENFQC